MFLNSHISVVPMLHVRHKTLFLILPLRPWDMNCLLELSRDLSFYQITCSCIWRCSALYFQVVKATAPGVAGTHCNNSERKRNEAEGKGLKLSSPGLTAVQKYSQATHLACQENERRTDIQSNCLSRLNPFNRKADSREPELKPLHNCYSASQAAEHQNPIWEFVMLPVKKRFDFLRRQQRYHSKLISVWGTNFHL